MNKTYQPFFEQVESINYEGTNTTNPLAFRHYNPISKILGKTMAEHLRFASCYWHTFCWHGSDVFGSGTFDRPWFLHGETIDAAKMKANAAFEFFKKLNVPFYCFHDMDVMPPANNLKDYINNFATMLDVLLAKQQETGVKLLWGTANCFSHPRYASGAATNPNPEVFAFAATQVHTALEATLKLGGANYVLWGGREGYETLLNTDLTREREQLGRFMQMVVEHKHKIGFKGTILIEPKPQEPTKHQYDHDVATVYGFLKEFGLEKEVKVNIEANHATLAGHSFHHEVATATSLGIFGSVDANRGDPQLGWDTDQFPNSIEENALVMYEILKSGGFVNGGFNFDAKLRRPSMDKYDLFYGHIGGMDTLALALKIAARMLEDGKLAKNINQRYSAWNNEFGKQIMQGKMSLADVAATAIAKDFAPIPASDHQELLENIVNGYIYG